jgi:hypothetical protein
MSLVCALWMGGAAAFAKAPFWLTIGSSAAVFICISLIFMPRGAGRRYAERLPPQDE